MLTRAIGMTCADRIRRLSLEWLGAAVFLLFASLVLATQTARAEGEVSVELLQQKIDEVAATSDLSDEARADLAGGLEAAIKQLERAAAMLAKAAEYAAVADSAGEEVHRFEELLAQAESKPLAMDDLLEEGVSPSRIESQIAIIESERKALAERRSLLLKTGEGWPARRKAIQGRLVELQVKIDEILPSQQVPADSLEGEIQYLQVQAWLQSLRAEQESLQQEILSMPSRLEVNSAERDWVARALADADLKLRALSEAALAARADESREKLESVAAIREELQDLSPGLKAYASENQELVRQLEQYSGELEQARQTSSEIQAQLEGIERDSALMSRRLEAAGRKDVLGQVMLKLLDQLPNTELIRRENRQRSEVIAERSLAYIDADEELLAINSRQQYIDEQFPGISGQETADFLDRLVDQRQQLLQASSESIKTLLRELLETSETSRGLISRADGFHRFLVGNLMWVRNFGNLSVSSLYAQLRVLFSPRDWATVPAGLQNGYSHHGWSAALLFILFATFALRRKFLAVHRARLSRPALLNADTLLNIILCPLLALVIVLPWPLFLYLVGSFLASAQPGTPFFHALAPALEAVAMGLYALLLARLLMNPIGVGRRLLKWDSRSLDILRRELNWAGPLVLLALFADVFAQNLDMLASGGALGAVANMAHAIAIVVFCIRLLRIGRFGSERYVRLPLQFVALLAVGVILMQLLGLLFAAELYLNALGRSILAALLLKTLGDILARVLLIMRARLGRKFRSDVRALEEEEGEEEPGIANHIDMAFLSEAHAKLLNIVVLGALVVALWMIWSPALPGLSLLESIELWQVSDASSPGFAPRYITLFDLVLGAIILVVTGLSARHLPTLVQLFLLEWVHVSDGARYASSILLQYVVVAAGVLIFLSTVGWEWSNLQWLVAALGVGIGFGLQEIVANFISGIIILFEQPIRVGDIISAGGAEGTVKKISARATVIQTFDGKEHLIPNKELITGEVVNWSLSENAVRVVIPVGIAYGSDVRRAMELLLEAAREVELVLDEPLPTATFEDFGDNSLVLWLRCYVAENRPLAWTELRTRINDKFAEAGIVIAFPQRDLHLDFTEALKVELDSGSASSPV